MTLSWFKTKTRTKTLNSDLYYRVILVLISVVAISILYFHTSIFYSQSFTLTEGMTTLNTNPEKKLDSIFVSIPSYRDKDCKDTMTRLFQKAKYPQRIYIGVFMQNSENPDEQCTHDTASIPTMYKHHIRYLHTDYRHAKGPLYARKQIIDQLYRGEKYFLMIDAHTNMIDNWDVNLIRMLETLKSEYRVKKPIISSYPDTMDEYKNRNNIKTTNVMCNLKKGHVYPVMLGAMKKPDGYFYKQFLMGGNGTFTYGTFFKEIQIDPTLQYVFNGEEFYFSALAYTNGWDIYSFPYNCLYHMYRTNEKKSGEKLDWYADSKGVRDINKERASHILLKRILTDERFATRHSYPMGTTRSLSSLYKEIGYEPKGRKFEEHWTNESTNRLCNEFPKLVYDKTNME